MELNLSQEISRVDHNSLFLVFLDLGKAYDTVDRGRLIWDLGGYGVGPRHCEILEIFWVH